MSAYIIFTREKTLDEQELATFPRKNDALARANRGVKRDSSAETFSIDRVSEWPHNET